MLGLPEYPSTAFRASYPGRRISFLHRDLNGLHFSGLEGSGKKQVAANSMHQKDNPYSLSPLYCSDRFHQVNLIHYTTI
jgi:hypothetical protein